MLRSRGVVMAGTVPLGKARVLPGEGERQGRCPNSRRRDGPCTVDVVRLRVQGRINKPQTSPGARRRYRARQGESMHVPSSTARAAIKYAKLLEGRRTA